MTYIKMLNNIQNCIFRACDHNEFFKDKNMTCSCSNCKDNGILIGGTLNTSFSIRYIFEKINTTPKTSL